MARWVGRVVFAWMGASFGSIAVALAEARQILANFDGARPPSFASLAFADVGVLAPLALGAGTAIVGASIFLEPGRALAPSERIALARARPVFERSRTAAMALLVCVMAAVWLTVVAHLGRRLLATGAPLASGGALAAATVVSALGLGAFGVALLPFVRRGLASGASRWPVAIDPAATGAVGLVLAVGLVALGVVLGDASGEGSGPLAIFGVLGRGELDLRPVVDLGAIAVCAWVGPLVLGGRPPRKLPLVVAIAVIVLPLFACAFDARGLDAEPVVTRAIEGQAPLGHIALAVDRRATDRDHDGASPLFGGGDCNDHDPTISPVALEIPGNGIDEDCSGADLPLPAAPATTVASSDTAAIDRDFNLVLITVDTLRASEVGFLGYDKPTTPNLDALAAESVVFDRAYSMASYTGKALAPMLIGRYPSETLRDGGHFNTYFPGNEFLAERLEAAGFTTMGAASHWYFKERYGVTQGIDSFDLSAVPPGGQGDTDSTTTGQPLTDAGIRLLQQGAAGHRFMLWVHYFDPHSQYVPHEGAPDFSDPSHPAGWRQHAAYDGEVWFTDEQIGRLLDYAKTQPWWKDTVVVLTSDHGEALGEHGINFQHGWEIWEPLMRIPLLFRVPGFRPHHVAVKRSAVDIVPTILDLMRVTAAPGELSGRSLLPDLLAGPGATYEERDVYLDMPDGPYTHMRRGLIRGPTPGMKLIHRGGTQYLLYDLSSDPGEHEDLAGDRSKLQPMIDAMNAKRATLHENDVKADAPASP